MGSHTCGHRMGFLWVGVWVSENSPSITSADDYCCHPSGLSQFEVPSCLDACVTVLLLPLSLSFVICYFLFVHMHYGTTFVVDIYFSLLTMFTDFYDVPYRSI